MTTKAELHELVDALPDELANEAAHRLQALAVPIDDEPVTAADLAAIAEAREEIARGDVLTLAEWRRQRSG
ncbi:MAG: hypothetical protein ACYDCQ_03330 [Dehalococcoidia bacterium]